MISPKKNMMGFLRDARDLQIVRFHEVAILLVITLLGTFFESISIAMLLPILQFIESGKNIAPLVAGSRLWQMIANWHQGLGMPVTLISLMSVVVLLVIARQIFTYTKGVYSTVVSERALLRIRSRGFRGYITTDMAFFSSHNIGGMINSLVLDGDNAAYAVMAMIQFVGLGVLLAGYVVFLMWISTSATFVTVAIMAVIGGVFIKLLRKSKRYGAVVSQFNKKFTEMLVERLGAVRLIKLASSQEREIESEKRIINTLYNQRFQIARIKSIIETSMQMMVLLAALAILYVSTEVFRMSMAEVSIFIFVLLRLLPIFQEFFTKSQSVISCLNSVASVKSMMVAAETQNSIHGGASEFTGLKRSIEFRDVSFHYDKTGAWVLDKVNFTIPAGCMTAIVGRSGAGKSTLVDLLPRLIVPDQGEILFDDIAISEFTLKSLRSSMAFVSQEGFLFDTSILENIRYSRPDAPMEEVRWAAQNAYIADFIEGLPEKYETQVGERGVKLSGGQKQRIILARALLQKASVIILDEPTSALDSESEKYIQHAIEDLRTKNGLTLVVVAHRLSTIRSADRILVIDKGRIVESGAHDELMHGDEWYGDMCRLQADPTGT